MSFSTNLMKPEQHLSAAHASTSRVTARSPSGSSAQALLSNRTALFAAITSLSLAAVSPSVMSGDNKPNPYAKPDNSFVSISGTVVDPGVELFELDYGQGTVTVEMDDWDSYGEARALMDGDIVTVYGRIDDDFFETTSIEAGAVYVDGLNTYFYASSDDEESASYYTPNLWIAPVSVAPSAMTLRGEVISVAEDDRTFVVSMGDETVEVETDMLGYNPVDDKGYQQIERGDWVSVTGMLDYEFLDGQVMRADTITTLYDESA